MSLVFSVYGTPAPQGSKRHVGNGVMVESSKRVKPWRQDVKEAALKAVAAAHGVEYAYEPMGGPLAVGVRFIIKRPASHFRTGKNAHLLRANAPEYPAKKPDIDKLLRSTLDALGEAGLWRDDSQVVHVQMSKVFDDGEAPGARISVHVMPGVAA